MEQKIECKILQDVIDYALSIKNNTWETRARAIIDLFNEWNKKNYYAAQIVWALKNESSKGTEQINKIIKNDEAFWSIMKELYPNSIIKNLFDHKYKEQIIRKCNLELREWESLLSLYIRSSQKSEIRPLIDFTLQNLDIINDVNIDTIYSINSEIITQNVLYEWNIQYQRFTQDLTTKIYNYVKSIEKAPFESPKDALNDMKKLD